MSNKSNRTTSYIRSMIKYCQDVLDLQTSFGGKSFTSFMNHKGYQYSVSFCIEQIGELAKKLREEGFAEKYPDISWNEIAGLRNRIAHGYDVIDLDMVYDISINDIPKLLQDCQEILRKENTLENKIQNAEQRAGTLQPGIAPGRTERE